MRNWKYPKKSLALGHIHRKMAELLFTDNGPSQNATQQRSVELFLEERTVDFLSQVTRIEGTVNHECK